jgi:hypothetical protein
MPQRLLARPWLALQPMLGEFLGGIIDVFHGCIE